VVGLFQPRHGLAQRGIEVFEFAGLLSLQVDVRLGELRIRLRQRAVELLQLAALQVQLDQLRRISGTTGMST